MEPSTSVALHFSLEVVGVAALAGLLGWAIQGRRRAAAWGLALLLLLQIVQAGQFVDSRTALRIVVWASAAASAFCAVTARERGLLWMAGWAIAVGARVALGIAGQSGALAPTGGELALHAVAAVGWLVLAVWTWRATRSSVRLRVVRSFVLVLLLVVVAAGAPLTRVVGGRIRDQQFRELRIQAQAQQTVFRRANEDILNRGSILSQTIAAAVVGNANVSEVSASLLQKIFTDLSFIAVLGADRSVLGQSGLDQAEAVSVAGSEAVTLALRGTPAPSVERVPGGLLTLGTTPSYRPGRPQAPDQIVAVLVLGRRFAAQQLGEISRQTGLATALVSPTKGELIASSDAGLAHVRVPAVALSSALDGRIWLGRLSSGERRFLATVAPLARADQSVPAAIVLAQPDTALARATIGVARTLFAAVLAAGFVALAIALFLGSQISRPLLELARVARRVEGGDLEAARDVGLNGKVDSDDDEVAVLAHAFGSMTGSLRSTIATEQDTRRRLEAIVGGMGEGLAAVDADFNVVSFNPAAERITGVRADAALGRKCYEVYGHKTRGKDGLPICDYLCPLRHGGGTDGGVTYTPERGRPVAVAITCSTLRDEDGKVIGGVDLIRDVAAEKLGSDILSNVSHELRTPLTLIKGYADLMRRPSLSAKQNNEYLAGILEGADRLERVTSVLVDVAAMDAGQLRAHPEAHDAEPIVRSAVERWKGRSADHDVRASVARGLPQVFADQHLIGRALDELIDNAVKFSPEGGPIVVAASPAPGGVQLSVKDRGIGISREERVHLDGEFTQGDASATRAFGGLGLGLALVRRVMAEHRSELKVASQAGRGSTFSFVLRTPKTTRPAARRRATRTRQRSVR